MKKGLSPIAIYTISQEIKIGLDFDWIKKNKSSLLDFTQFKTYSRNRSRNYLRISKFSFETMKCIFNLIELNSKQHFKENGNSNNNYSLVGFGHIGYFGEKKLRFYGNNLNEKHLENILSTGNVLEDNYFGSRSYIIDFE